MANTTTETRREESKHVLYEIEMFCKLAEYFESGVVDTAVQALYANGLVVRNAMVEAFQMHARQLIDFLTDPDPRDSRASHFTKGPWQLERTPARKQNWERFSQRVMHLSLKRATFTPNERQVETRRIRRDLGADIEQFLDAVDDDRVCKGFLAQARAALLASEPLPDLGALLGPVGATEAVGQYHGGTATYPL